MSWHFKPSPNRWEKFFPEEILLIYSKLSGEDYNFDTKDRVMKKLLIELKAWVDNDLKREIGSM